MKFRRRGYRVSRRRSFRSRRRYGRRRSYSRPRQRIGFRM